MKLSESRFHQIIDQFSKLDPILVVGDIGIDKYTFGEVNRISPEAPVPILEVTREWLKLGLAANVTDNLQSLGVGSTLCGVIGDDLYGQKVESLLEEQGLKTWGLVHALGRKTTLKERVTTSLQQICRIDHEDTRDMSKQDEKRVIKRALEFSPTHKILIIEDYAKGMISEGLCRELISEFNKDGRLVAIDPGRTTNPLFYKGANVLKPNLIESKSMLNSLRVKVNDLKEIGKALREELEIENLVITLGKEGMAIWNDQYQNAPFLIPTVANEVYDVSGAGDTVISTIASCLLAGASIEEACFIANCAAGVVVSKRGTACIRPDELTNFFKKIS